MYFVTGNVESPDAASLVFLVTFGSGKKISKYTLDKI